MKRDGTEMPARNSYSCVRRARRGGSAPPRRSCRPCRRRRGPPRRSPAPSRSAPTAPEERPEEMKKTGLRARHGDGAESPPLELPISSGAVTPRARSLLLEPGEIAAQRRQHVGVDRRGRGALVLAGLGQHVDRGGDGDLGKASRERGGRGALVRRVGVGIEEADRRPSRCLRRERSAPAASTLVERRRRRGPMPSASVRSATSSR